MGKKENNGGLLKNNSSGMLWFDFVTRIFMPIQAIVCFIFSAFTLVFATFCIEDITASILKKPRFWSELGKKLEEAGITGEKFSVRSEVSEMGLFFLTISIMFLAVGIFTFVSRNSLLYFEKKSVKIFVALYAAFAGVFLFIAFSLWVYDFKLPLIIVSLIVTAAIVVWGVINILYLRKKSYQFTI